MASMNSRAKEVIAELDQFEADMNLTNKWVHGDENMTVLLGGVSTPSIRNLVKNFRLSAQEVLDAAEYIQDNFDGLEDIIDANREYAEIAGLLMLKIADWMVRDLAEFNKINIDRYNEWYAHGIERIGEAGMKAGQCVQNIRDIIAAFDESVARHKLQQRLFDGTNPTSSSKPVLFVISGQSNAVGGGKYKPFDSAPDCGQFWFWRDEENQELRPIVDPTGNLTYGSGWAAFARKFYALTGRKALLLNIAASGAAVTDGGYTTENTWADNGYGTLRTSRTAIWNAFSAAVPASSYDVGAILWIQGENDGGRIASGRISKSDYKTATIDVWNWTRTLISVSNCPVFVGKIAYVTSSLTDDDIRNGYATIQKAQEELCDYSTVYPGFFMTPEFINCVDLFYSDSNHYSRYGYKIVGEGFARSVVNYLGF